MVSSEKWRFQKHAWIATLFALVSGYADVVSLVRYQCFATMLTGNVVWLGRAMVTPETSKHPPWYYLCIIGSYALGALTHRLCELRWPNRGGTVAGAPFALFMLAAEILYFLGEWEVMQWTVVLVSPLFGVIAAACSTGRMGTQTTMVTGHILTLSSLFGSLIWERQLNPEDGAKLIMSAMVVLGNVAGASIGALCLKDVVFPHLLFPLPFVFYGLMWLHDHLARPRSFIKKMQTKWRNKAAAASGDCESVESVSETQDSQISDDDRA